MFDVLVLQNCVVVVQNNDKERQNACKFVFFLLIRKKKCATRAICFFLLIRSIDHDAIFIAPPV